MSCDSPARALSCSRRRHSGTLMARILSLLEGRQNRELLEQWLSQYHLITDQADESPIDETVDMCIVDGPSLVRYRQRLVARRDQELPGFFPVLLLTPHRDVWAR